MELGELQQRKAFHPSKQPGAIRTAGIVLGLGLFDVLVFGWPFFSLFIILAGLRYLYGTLAARKDHRRAMLFAKKALIALLIGPMAMAATNYDMAQATSRAELVADALRQFKTGHGHYPAKLQELVPEFLGAVPRARLASMASEFHYFPDPEDPSLMWTVMAPFGRTILHVGSGERRTID